MKGDGKQVEQEERFRQNDWHKENEVCFRIQGWPCVVNEGASEGWLVNDILMWRALSQGTAVGAAMSREAYYLYKPLRSHSLLW